MTLTRFGLEIGEVSLPSTAAGGKRQAGDVRPLEADASGALLVGPVGAGLSPESPALTEGWRWIDWQQMRKILGIQMSRGQRLGFWTAAAFFVLATIVAMLLWFLSKRDAQISRQQSERTEGKVDVLTKQFGQMQARLDGLPKSEPAVRKPFELGLAAMDAYKWDEAIGHFREAMKEAKGTQLVALTNLIGKCHYMPGHLGEALMDYEESARLAEQLGDTLGRAADLGNIGNIYSAKGEPDSALKHYEEALALARGIKDPQGVANQLGNIGLIYGNKGESDSALEYLEGARAVFGDRYPKGKANALGCIGNVYRAKGEPDKALKYYEEALALARKIKDPQGEANQLSGIGLILRDRGEPDSALKYLERAQAIDREASYPQGVASQLGYIGTIYGDEGESDKALKYLEEALAIDRELGHPQGVANQLGNIGLVLTGMGKFEQAVPNLVEALGIYSAIGVAEDTGKVLRGLVACEDKLGRKKMGGLFRKAGLDNETIVSWLKLIDQTRRETGGAKR